MIALFFDTETTGFVNPANPSEIVQIGAILQDCDTKRVLGEINLICKASKPMPQSCIDVHGITDELSQTVGIDPRIADNMFGLLAGRADVLVAHNMNFDREIIKGIWPVSTSVIEGKREYCTMLEGAKLDIPKRHAGKGKWPKLSDSYFHFFQENFENAHDAMADVRACRDVYFALINANKKE